MESESAKNIFSDVYSDEWQSDFRKKEELLSSHFDKITPADYYQQVFGDEKVPCKLFVQEIEKYKFAKDFSAVEKYQADFRGVCVYLQSFFRNMTASHRNIDKYYGFVVDLDNVRSAGLPEVIAKIKNTSYKPNIVVSSGNGIHLYYLFSQPFDFYSFTYVVSMLDYRKRELVMKVVNQVYDKLCDMYEDDEVGYKVDRGHLSRPIRMCGSTTKNVNFRTVGYTITNERMSLEEYAEMFGVELIDDRVATSIDQYLQKDFDEMPEIISEPAPDIAQPTEKSEKSGIFDDINTTFVEYYRDNKADVRARWLEYAKRLGDEDRPATATAQVRQKKQTAKESNHSNYISTLLRIKFGAKVGNRQKLLLIFCSRAAMYRVPEQRMKDDAREIMMYWNEKWPNDVVRDKELESAFHGYKRYRFRNETIKQQTGVDLKLENKRETERVRKKSIKDMNRSNMRKCAVNYIQDNRGCSYMQIADYLALNGFDVSGATIKRDEVIRTAKESG